MKQQETVQEAQGVKKVQKASVSYALEAFGKHAVTLKETGVFTQEEFNQLFELREKAVRNFVKQKYGI